MLSYVIIGIAFLYFAVQLAFYFSRRRTPLTREDIDERLLAALNGGDRQHG